MDSYEPILATETIKYPGYIEFDEPTKMAVTKTKNPDTLKIWCLESYALLMSLSPEKARMIYEVRFGDKIVMFIRQKARGYPGSMFFEIFHPILKQKLREVDLDYDCAIPLSCIELFNENIIFK